MCAFEFILHKNRHYIVVKDEAHQTYKTVTQPAFIDKRPTIPIVKIKESILEAPI